MEDARISGTNQFLGETKCFASKLLAYSFGRKFTIASPLVRQDPKFDKYGQ